MPRGKLSAHIKIYSLKGCVRSDIQWLLLKYGGKLTLWTLKSYFLKFCLGFQDNIFNIDLSIIDEYTRQT